MGRNPWLKRLALRRTEASHRFSPARTTAPPRECAREFHPQTEHQLPLPGDCRVSRLLQILRNRKTPAREYRRESLAPEAMEKTSEKPHRAGDREAASPFHRRNA